MRRLLYVSESGKLLAILAWEGLYESRGPDGDWRGLAVADVFFVNVDEYRDQETSLRFEEVAYKRHLKFASRSTWYSKIGGLASYHM